MNKKEMGELIYQSKLFYCERYGITVRRCKLYGCKYHKECPNPEKSNEFEAVEMI